MRMLWKHCWAYMWGQVSYYISGLILRSCPCFWWVLSVYPTEISDRDSSVLHIPSTLRMTSVYVVVLVTKSCSTLCDPMDCSRPGSSVHGILQVRILEWVAISFPRGSSWPRNRTQVFCTAGRFLTDWATREALVNGVVFCIVIEMLRTGSDTQ